MSQTRNILVTLCGLSVQIVSFPNTIQSVPMSMQSVPMSMQSVPMTIQSVPMSIQSVPMTIQSVPVSIQSVPANIQSVPMIIQSVPVSIQSVPVSMQSVSVISMSVPFQPGEEMYLCSRSCITLQLFVKDNQGDEDETSLEYLSFYGTPLDVTNMKDFKRVRLHGNITLHLS